MLVPWKGPMGYAPYIRLKQVDKKTEVAILCTTKVYKAVKMMHDFLA